MTRKQVNSFVDAFLIRGERAVIVLLGAILIPALVCAEPDVPASDALPLPAGDGDGVTVKVFNGIVPMGPMPGELVGIAPDAEFVSPRISFPSPNFFETSATFGEFFSDTVMAPDSIRDLPADQFVMEMSGYIKITQDMDTDESTPEIDVRFEVWNSGGIHLSMGSITFFQFLDLPLGNWPIIVSFGSEGLYPLQWIYSYNDLNNFFFPGVPGSYLWIWPQSNASEVFPQSHLYSQLSNNKRTITFEEHPPGTVVSDQYLDAGARFSVTSGGVEITDARPDDFVPVSGAQVFADPRLSPGEDGIVDITFVGPDGTTAASTDCVTFSVIDADPPGVSVKAFDPQGLEVDSQVFQGGGQENVTIESDYIARVSLNLGGAEGGDNAAIDDLSFAAPGVTSVSVAIVPEEGGTVSGDGLYALGAMASLSAEPATDFIEWQNASGEVLSETNPYAFTVTNSTSLSAVFVRPATIQLNALEQVFDGGSKQVEVITNPPGLPVDVFYTINEQAVIPSAVGEYHVTAKINDRYHRGETTRTLVIKKDQTIDFPSLSSTIGEIPLEATASSGLPIRFESSPSHVASVSGNILNAHQGGAISIRAVQDGNSEFWPAEASQSLRLPPVIREVTVNGVLIDSGFTLTRDTTLAVEARDTDGISEAIFYGRRAASDPWETIASDSDSSDGLAALLPVNQLEDGTYELRVEVITASEHRNEKTFAGMVTIAPTLNVELGDVVTEGDTLEGVVSIQSMLESDLPVSLRSSRPGQLDPGPPVVIPAGQLVAPFIINGLDDIQIDPPLNVTIQASAPGALIAEKVVTLMDNDWPLLTLTLNSTVVSEADGPSAVLATLERDPVSAEPVMIALSHSNPAAVTVPEFVTIPSNLAAIEFPIDVIDDTVVNGVRTTEIKAELRLTGIGTVVESDLVQLEISDDEGPRIVVAMDPPWLLEGESRKLSVRRIDSSTVNALTVTLFPEPSGQVDMPLSVEIPSGSEETAVTVSGIADALNDGKQTIIITGSAQSHGAGQASIVLTEEQLPDLVIRDLESENAVDADEAFIVSYRIENQGAVPTSAPFTQRVWLSTDRVLGDDLLISQDIFTGVLENGIGFGQSKSVRAPTEVGSYWLFVTTDAGLTLEEIIETNNSALFAEPIIVHPPYSATVDAGVSVVPANTPITFSGSAVREDSSKVASAMVTIRIRTRGTERLISALTNSEGDYAVTWKPLPGEGGEYEIGATHPGVALAPTQDTFTILTIDTQFPNQGIGFEEGSGTSFTAEIANPNVHQLTGMVLDVVEPPAGLSVNAVLPGTTLDAGNRFEVNIDVSAVAGYHGVGVLVFLLNTDQGVTQEFSVPVSVTPLMPVLSITPEPLSCSVVRGSQKLASLTVKNEGGIASGPVTVLLPDLPWMSVASPSPLDSLEPGDETSINLLLAPDENEPLTVYEGSLIVAPENGESKRLPFAIRVVSDLMGDLEIEVVDEYFYFTSEAPKVEGATVIVRDAITAEEIIQSSTNSDGRAVLTDLKEGWYAVEVDTPKHTAWRGNIFVDAGDANQQQIFISRETVTYTWTVEEIEIADRYKIDVETTFETNVPAPVVTVTPSVLELGDLVTLGQTKVVNFTFENHGFIAAEHGRFTFDEHPFYEVTPLIEDVGTIAAKSSITVPVTVKRIGEFAEDGSIRTLGGASLRSLALANAAVGEEPVSCALNGHFTLSFLCGLIEIGKYIPIPGSETQGSCDVGDFGPDLPPIRPPNRPRENGPDGDIPDLNPGISFSTTSICDCENFRKLLNKPIKLCGSFNVGNEFNKWKNALRKRLPPWADVELDLGVEACALAEICCVEGNLGVKGNGSFEASGGITLKLGFFPDRFVENFLRIYAPVSGDWTIDAIEVEVDPNGFDGELIFPLEIGLKGRIGFEITKECNEVPEVCISGGYEVDWLSGLSLRLKINARKGNVRYSGEASYTVGLGIDAFLKGAYCIGVPDGRGIEGCVKIQLKNDAEINVSMEPEIFEVGKANLTLSLIPGNNNTVIWDSCKETGSLKADLNDYSVQESIVGGASFLSDAEILRSAIQEVSVGDGVCAKVKINLDQDAVMTRSAFRASLELGNNLQEGSLTDVGFDLIVRDRTGALANDVFDVRVSALDGLLAIDGSGEIGPDSTGRVQWTLIPLDAAAPEADTVYTVGGTIAYVQNGTEFRIPVEPMAITVRPDAALHLKYFHQRDVVSDDPHTEMIEPAVPYALAVMVENRGAGAARNLSITSAQPEIVDNEKGLLIDFQIIGTEVAGETLSPSLTVEFGEIQPGERKIGTWLMTSTLQGLFIDYEATFEHLDGFGDPRLSLIKEVEIHEMIHMIEALGDKADGLPDFLVNDVADLRDLPDTVHLSDGTTAPVAIFETATLDGEVDESNLMVTMNTAMNSGWSYLRIAEPSNGAFRLVRVIRSDGLEIPLDKNVWVTDRTFVGLGRRPVYENVLHLADCDSTGSYSLHYELLSGEDVTAPESMVAMLDSQSPSQIPIHWTGEDDEAIATYDIYVATDGGPFERWLEDTARTSAIFEGDAGKSYSFYSIARDLSGNEEAAPLTADAMTEVSITNRVPVIEMIPDQTIIEGDTFRLAATATDPDNDEIRYAITSDSDGLVIDQSNGQMRWITGESDGGRTLNVTVTAIDNGVPAKEASASFKITVLDENSPPAIEEVPRQLVGVEEILLVDVDAVDVDEPVQTLHYRLGMGAPNGISIDPNTGVVTWVPQPDFGGQDVVIEVMVTDSGTPARSSSIRFPVSVALPLDRAPVFPNEIPVVLWLRGKSYTLTVMASDPEGDAVALSADLGSLAGQLGFQDLGSGQGQFDWPEINAIDGLYQVPVRATAKGLSTSENLTIRVVEDDLYWKWALDRLAGQATLSEIELDADPDGDKRNNLTEMVFLTDPMRVDEMELDGRTEFIQPWAVTDMVFSRRVGSQEFLRIYPIRSSTLSEDSWERISESEWDATIIHQDMEQGVETIRLRILEHDVGGDILRKFYGLGVEGIK